jgi:hypothetical protein
MSEEVALPTAQPSSGFIVLLKGGPKDIEVSSVSAGLVTVPQLDPSKCKITPLPPTAQPSLAVLRKIELKVKAVAGRVGI